MSRPRLHKILLTLFENKDTATLAEILNHEDYHLFQKNHGLDIPSDELIQVFTHTSFSHEFGLPDQEQLEFLGDAVLQMILTEELYRRFPEEKEGRLSKLRSSLVNEKSLASVATHLALGELLLVGKGEFKKNLFTQEVVLADTLEALLARIYCSHGLERTRVLFLEWLMQAQPDAFNWEKLNEFDAKSKLQELSLARYKKLPRYQAMAEGEKFRIEVLINDQIVASGVFASKKNGEKELAQEIIKKGIF